MFKTTKNEFPQLTAKITRAKGEIAPMGDRWVQSSVYNLDRHIRHHLRTQGRGGQPPALSTATEKIYQHYGPPDGSGVRNHITIEFERDGNGTSAILGIPTGKPTTVAKVQDRGAVIRVTPKMRAYLHAAGIHLRADTTTIQIPGRFFWKMSNVNARRESKELLRQLAKEIWRKS